MLFVGPVDQGVSFAVAKGVRDAGGTVVRTRSISVPLDVAAIQDGLRGDPAFRRYLGSDHIADLGDALAKELAAGGKTPLWDALGKIIVQEREGSATPPADAVVVVRSAEPQRGLTKALLAGMYGGLARSGVPAVGTEAAGTSPERHPRVLAGGPLDRRLGRHLGRPARARAPPRRRRARELRRRGDGQRRRAAVDPSRSSRRGERPAQRPADGARRSA